MSSEDNEAWVPKGLYHEPRPHLDFLVSSEGCALACPLFLYKRGAQNCTVQSTPLWQPSTASSLGNRVAGLRGRKSLLYVSAHFLRDIGIVRYDSPAQDYQGPNLSFHRFIICMGYRSKSLYASTLPEEWERKRGGIINWYLEIFIIFKEECTKSIFPILDTQLSLEIRRYQKNFKSILLKRGLFGKIFSIKKRILQMLTFDHLLDIAYIEFQVLGNKYFAFDGIIWINKWFSLHSLRITVFPHRGCWGC